MLAEIFNANTSIYVYRIRPSHSGGLYTPWSALYIFHFPIDLGNYAVSPQKEPLHSYLQMPSVPLYDF